MRPVTALTVLALGSIAVLTGGAAAKLIVALDAPAGMLSLAVVAAALLVVVVVTDRSRERTWTPYWE